MSYSQKGFKYYEWELWELAHRKAAMWMWPEEGDADFKTAHQVAQAKTLRGILFPLLKGIADRGASPFQVRSISELLPDVNIRGLILQTQGDHGSPAAIQEAAGELVMERIYGPRDAQYARYPDQALIDTAIEYGEALVHVMHEISINNGNPLAMSAKQLLPIHVASAEMAEAVDVVDAPAALAA
jgi:hypothetical protein